MASAKEKMKSKVLEEGNLNAITEKVFKEADLNQNGTIEANELEVLLKGIHESLQIPPPTQADITNELKRLDKNKDGVISKEEFKTLVKEIVCFSIDQME